MWIALGLHGGLGAWIFALPETPKPRPATVITIREQKVDRKPAPPPPPPPAPPAVADAPPAPAPTKPKAAPKKVAKAPPAEASAPAPAAATPAAPPAFAGVMSGTGSGPGMAVPAAAPAAAEPAPTRAKAKVLGEKKPAVTDGCGDALVKPKPIAVAQPAYTDAARAAGIAGKVRVEVSISASGEVTSVKVLEGLGHGLDEAALAAARKSTFTPATRCGAAVATTFTIGMRFTL